MSLDLTGLRVGMLVVVAAEKEYAGDAIMVAKLVEMQHDEGDARNEQGKGKWFSRKAGYRKYYDVDEGHGKIGLDIIVYFDFKLNRDATLPRKVMNEVAGSMGIDQDELFGDN